MKYLPYITIPLLSLALSANAEVFKCKNTAGKIVYQSEPCASGAITQGVIKVKELTPEQAEEAKAKLAAWKQQQAIDDAAKREIAKQQQTEMQRQESLELQRRSVIAQEQQANSVQQRQNQGGGIYNQPYGYNGRYLNDQYYSPYNQWHPNMPRPHYQHNVPWSDTPAGQAPATTRTPAGQAPAPLYPQPGQAPIRMIQH
jgi:Domain of unknown function (DUF4124)